jgi:peptide-methionine (S)-S-oxide reductase
MAYSRRLISRVRLAWLLPLLLLATPVDAQTLQPAPAAGLRTAAFAGGCFWCMVHPFDQLAGVSAVVAGYTGGNVQQPTYEQVSAGGTGHRESVQVTYDPTKISYQKLLDVFWRNVDPLNAGGQFCDRGMQYTTAIFTADDEQKRLAEQSLASIQERFAGKAVTQIIPAGPFWRAEDYHQDYYRKNPLHYRFYRYTCGRDARLDEVWGKEARGGEPAAH